jgi:hypothetical protein
MTFLSSGVICYLLLKFCYYYDFPLGHHSMECSASDSHDHSAISILFEDLISFFLSGLGGWYRMPKFKWQCLAISQRGSWMFRIWSTSRANPLKLDIGVGHTERRPDWLFQTRWRGNLKEMPHPPLNYLMRGVFSFAVDFKFRGSTRRSFKDLHPDRLRPEQALFQKPIKSHFQGIQACGITSLQEINLPESHDINVLGSNVKLKGFSNFFAVKNFIQTSSNF